jgi:hypothetical protein
LPKNDGAFPDRLKELQKTYRQHARDEKRELLPAVRRALSEDQIQGVAQKIEAGIAEAERARHDELEDRRLKARQERERAEREAQRQAEAEEATQAAAEQGEQRQAKARQERAQAAQHSQPPLSRCGTRRNILSRMPLKNAVGAVARTATLAPADGLPLVKGAASSALRMGEEVRGATHTYVSSVKGVGPDLRAVAALPRIALGAMAELRSAWIEWVGQTTRASAAISQELVLQATEQQRRFAAEAVQGWMQHNARVMEIAIHAAQEALRLSANSPLDR